MNNKYYVSVKGDNYETTLKGFGNLAEAYKFYLEDIPKRTILKEIEPKVVEGGE